MYGSIFFNHRVVPHWNSLPATTCGQRTLSEQFQVAIGHVWARYGRQKPMSFLVHQQSSSSSSSHSVISIFFSLWLKHSCSINCHHRTCPSPSIHTYVHTYLFQATTAHRTDRQYKNRVGKEESKKPIGATMLNN